MEKTLCMFFSLFHLAVPVSPREKRVRVDFVRMRHDLCLKMIQSYVCMYIHTLTLSSPQLSPSPCLTLPCLCMYVMYLYMYCTYIRMYHTGMYVSLLSVSPTSYKLCIRKQYIVKYVWLCMSTIVTYSKRGSHANTFLDKTFIVIITIPGNCLRNHGWVTNNKVSS